MTTNQLVMAFNFPATIVVYPVGEFIGGIDVAPVQGEVVIVEVPGDIGPVEVAGVIEDEEF